MVAHKNLKLVNKPSRYLGGEMGISIKSKQNTRVVLLVPTVYEDAMSNNVVTSIYNYVNSLDGIWLERIFAPMLDYENLLRRENENLTTLESGTNLKDVNLILVLIDDIMQITNALNILNLAKIPILSSRRDETFPLVIFSGKAMLNPKPFLKFADGIICGEVENTIKEVLDVYTSNIKENKKKIIEKLDELKYTYTNLNKEKEVEGYLSEEFKYASTKNSIISSISHDVNITSVFKGSEDISNPDTYIYTDCIKKSNAIFEIKDKILKTGEKKILIDVKNVLDFKKIRDIIYGIEADEDLKNSKISLLNAEITKNNLEFLKYINGKAEVVLDEGYKKQDVLELAQGIFEHGCSEIKLKYTLGRQKENYENLIELLSLAEQIIKKYFSLYPNSSKTNIVTIELIPFIPYIQTPFEWYEMNTPEKLELKIRYIKDKNANENINIIPFEPCVPCIKTMILRGDEEVGNIIYDAWKNGARLDNYDIFFRSEPWEIALNRNKRNLKGFLERIDTEVKLPWDNIKIRTSKQELVKIYRNRIGHEI